MQARRASRELALILFSQFEKEITHYSRNDFENIMLKSVRILSNSASEELKLTIGSLIDIKSFANIAVKPYYTEEILEFKLELFFNVSIYNYLKTQKLIKRFKKTLEGRR